MSFFSQKVSYMGAHRQYVRSNLPTPYGITVFGNFMYWVDRNQQKLLKSRKILVTSPTKWLKAGLQSLSDIVIFDKNRQPNGKTCL